MCHKVWPISLWDYRIVMGPSSGPARARPGPIHFSRDRAWNFKKDPSLTQARDWFFEKGLENWDFYVVKNTGLLRLGIELLWRAWAQLKMDIQGSGSAQDRFFRARPITNHNEWFTYYTITYCIIHTWILDTMLYLETTTNTIFQLHVYFYV